LAGEEQRGVVLIVVNAATGAGLQQQLHTGLTPYRCRNFQGPAVPAVVCVIQIMQ
jgi:hypothetical protein